MIWECSSNSIKMLNEMLYNETLKFKVTVTVKTKYVHFRVMWVVASALPSRLILKLQFIWNSNKLTLLQKIKSLTTLKKKNGVRFNFNFHLEIACTFHK